MCISKHDLVSSVFSSKIREYGKNGFSIYSFYKDISFLQQTGDENRQIYQSEGVILI